MAASSRTMSVKLMIDNKQSKVVFAEAGKDFVDFLLHLLTMPIGTVIRLLKKDSMVGCISNLYGSIEKLNDTYIQPNQTKDSLLDPQLSTSLPLLLPAPAPAPAPAWPKLYCCSVHSGYVTEHKDAICPGCGIYPSRYSRSMSQEVRFVASNSSSSSATAKPKVSNDGGFVKGLVTYMVTDDLSVSPMSMISGITLLQKYNVKDFGSLEEKVVNVGINEGLKLLQASLMCKAALTYVFVTNSGEDSGTSKRART